MIQRTPDDIKLINEIALANNRQAFIDSLRQAGYIVLDIEPSITLLEKANGLYRKDKAGWVEFIKRIPFRQDVNNWTTSQETIDALTAYANNPEVIIATGKNPAVQKINFADIFTTFGDFIGGSSVTTSTTTKPPPVSNSTVAIVVAIVVVSLVGIFIIGTRLIK